MTDKNKKIIKLFIRLIVTAGLLTWAFSQIDEPQQFWQSIKTARWQFLIAVWALTIILFWIRSIKMGLILKKQNCDVNVATVFRASAVTSFYSMIIPGLFSTGAKWYILKKDTGKGTNVFSSMVYNQLSLMIVITTLGLAALIVTNPASLLLSEAKNQWLLPVVCAILLAVIILFSLLLLNSKTGRKIIKILSYMLKPFPAKMRKTAEEILDQIKLFQTVGWRFHLIIAFITIVGLVVCVTMYNFSARGANITVPAGIFVWLYVVIYILGRVPISIANLGVREVTLVGLLALYGVETSAALLMSMILFSCAILMAIIGAIYQLLWAVSAKKLAQLSRKPPTTS